MPIWSRSAFAPVAVAVIVAALGAPLGWLWAALAPDVPVQVVDGGVVPTEPEPEGFFAADGWFVLLGVGFGLLAAIAVWFLLRRHRGPVVLVALAVGTVGAGLIAGWLGHKVGLSGYHERVTQAPLGTDLQRPPELRAKELGWWFGFIPRVQGDLLVPAIAAAIGYTMLAAWSRHPSLREADPTVPGDPAQPGESPGDPAVLGDPARPEGQPGASARPEGQPGEEGRPGQFELGGTASSDSGTGTART